MSGGGTQTTVTQAADPWYKAEARELYGEGRQYLRNTPYQPYPGSTVAQFQPMQLAAQDYLSQAFLGQSMPYRPPTTGGPYYPQYDPYSPYGTPGGAPPPAPPPQPKQPPPPPIGGDGALLRAPQTREQAELERGQRLMGGGAQQINAPFMNNSGAPPGYPADWRNQFPGPYPAGMPIWLDSWGQTPSEVYYGIPGGGYIKRPYGDPTPYVDPVPGGTPPDKTWPGPPPPRPTPPPPTPPPPTPPPPPGGSPEDGTPPPYGPPMGAALGGSGIFEAQDAAEIARRIAASGGNYPNIHPMMAGFERVGAPGATYRGDVNAQNVTTGDLTGGIGRYRDPYENQVVNTALSDIDRARQLATNDARSRATLSGAFGGDRAALVEAETNRAYLDQAARTAAQLRSQGFDRAAGLAESDASRALTAGLSNQGAGLSAALANQGRFQDLSQFNAGLGLQAGLANQGAGVQTGLANQGANLQGQLANQAAWFQGRGQQLQGAGLLSAFGGDVFNRTLGVGSALSGIGAEQQGMAQDQIGADMAQFYEMQNWPRQNFGFLSGLLSGVPQDLKTSSYVPRNRGAGFLGGALSGGGMFAKTGNPWAIGAGALGGGLMGLL